AQPRRGLHHARRSAIPRGGSMMKSSSSKNEATLWTLVMEEPPQIQSIRELASLVGRGQSPIRRWLVHREGPFARNPPWAFSLLPEIQSWARKTLSPNPADFPLGRKRSPRPPKDAPFFTYFLYSPEAAAVKIGKSQDVLSRQTILEAGSPF